MEELGLDRQWIGKNNREDMTEPVRSLRASAQALGLLRVGKGRLLPTKTGSALKDDALGLWRHVAERAGTPPRDPFGRVATALLLLTVAAGRDEKTRLDPVLSAAGWRTGSGASVSQWAPRRAAEKATAVLDAIGTYGELGRALGGARTPTPGAQELAAGGAACRWTLSWLSRFTAPRSARDRSGPRGPRSRAQGTRLGPRPPTRRPHRRSRQ